MPLGLPLATGAPAGAVPQPGELSLVSGQLEIRDSEEPADLALPTKFDLTVDDANGRITAGTFSAAPLSFSFPITSPVPAMVFVDAAFTQITPGAVSSDSNLRKTSETTADVSVGVDVRVDLHIEIGNPAFATADCTAQPISLRLTSKAPYDYETGAVTLEDADFRVPPVPAVNPSPPNPGCPSIIADGVNEMLAGGGHSITMNMEGDLPYVRIGICKTTTTLVVEPISSRQGDEVTLSATLAKVDADPCNPAPADPITGVVDFFDGDNLLGSAPVDGSGEAAFSSTTLPIGNRSFTAKYNGDEVYAPGDPTDTVGHPVAAAPTVTLPDPINDIVIEGNARPVTVALANPTEFGEAIFGARLDLTVARVSSLNSILTPNRMSLEYFDGSAWTPVTLTQVSPNVLRGSVSGLDLNPGDNVNARFRYRAFAVVPLTNPPSTSCQAAQATCPGPLTMTAQLLTGDGARTLATDEGPVNLTEITRRPTTAAFAGGVIRPHTVRQGYSLLAATTLSPSFGGVPWAGVAEAYIDGVQVPMRDNATPFDTGYTNQFVVRTAGITPWILLPEDIEPGPHWLTVRYLGDAIHGPAEVSGVFTVIESLSEPLSHPFICREQTLTAQVEWGANVVFDTELPATAFAGAEVPFTVDDARLLMHRRTVNTLALFAVNNTTTPLGTNKLQSLSFSLAGQGSAEGTAVTRTGDVLLPNNPYPAAAADVDQTFEVHGVDGSFTVAGEPGEVVPVELSEFVMSYSDPFFNFPLEVRCTARGGLMKVGEVEVAGTTVTATPNPAREITDEVDIEAETFPADAAGTVTFTSSLDGALGSDAVSSGSAELATTALSPGVHTITASFNATNPNVPDSVGTATVVVQYSPRTGTQAFVIAARTDFTGVAAKDVVLADTAALAAGKKKSTYLNELARTDEYLTHVIDQMYLDTLGRQSDAAGAEHWLGKLRSGTSVARVASSFYGSPEYHARAGGTDEAWVDDLYDTLLGRAADAAGRTYWVGQIPRRGRSGVAFAFFQTPESARARVTGLYQQFLGRTPSAADRDFWASRVIARGDLTLAVELTLSPEYANRAGNRFPLV